MNIVSADDWKFLLALVVTLLFLMACAAAPLIAANLVSPWLGLIVATGSFWVWLRFGPPPMPGFLSGIVCTSGVFAIIGSFVICVILLIGGH